MKWERRDAKRKKRMPLHGRTIGVVYQAVIAKKT